MRGAGDGGNEDTHQLKHDRYERAGRKTDRCQSRCLLLNPNSSNLKRPIWEVVDTEGSRFRRQEYLAEIDHGECEWWRGVAASHDLGSSLTTMDSRLSE